MGGVSKIVLWDRNQRHPIGRGNRLLWPFINFGFSGLPLHCSIFLFTDGGAMPRLFWKILKIFQKFGKFLEKIQCWSPQNGCKLKDLEDFWINPPSDSNIAILSSKKSRKKLRKILNPKIKFRKIAYIWWFFRLSSSF